MDPQKRELIRREAVPCEFGTVKIFKSSLEELLTDSAALEEAMREKDDVVARYSDAIDRLKADLAKTREELAQAEVEIDEINDRAAEYPA